MTQHYIGTKQVQAWEAVGKDGVTPGYGVKYDDGYTSWSPKETFEKAYLPMGHFGETHPNAGQGNSRTITQAMVDEFIAKVETHTLGVKTTVVQVTLANGFEIVDSSTCVDPANYSEEMGRDICLERIKGKVWFLLGFTLQWAVTGLK